MCCVWWFTIQAGNVNTTVWKTTRLKMNWIWQLTLYGWDLGYYKVCVTSGSHVYWKTHKEHQMTIIGTDLAVWYWGQFIPTVDCAGVTRHISILNPQEVDVIPWHSGSLASGLVTPQWMQIYYCQMLQILHTNMKNRWPGKLNDGIIPLHDCPSPCGP